MHLAGKGLIPDLIYFQSALKSLYQLAVKGCRLMPGATGGGGPVGRLCGGEQPATTRQTLLRSILLL